MLIAKRLLGPPNPKVSVFSSCRHSGASEVGEDGVTHPVPPHPEFFRIGTRMCSPHDKGNVRSSQLGLDPRARRNA